MRISLIARMRSLIAFTFLTTIQIVDNSLSGKEHDDIKPIHENNDFLFDDESDESHEPSGDASQQFCEGNNERCKVRSM